MSSWLLIAGGVVMAFGIGLMRTLGPWWFLLLLSAGIPIYFGASGLLLARRDYDERQQAKRRADKAIFDMLAGLSKSKKKRKRDNSRRLFAAHRYGEPYAPEGQLQLFINGLTIADGSLIRCFVASFAVPPAVSGP